MGGMEMMLKAMGFDPAELKRYADGFLQTFNALNERLQRVETNQQRILEILENVGYSTRIGGVGETLKGEGETSESAKRET